MLKKTHVAVGTTAALAVIKPDTMPLIATITISSAIASLVPDADTENGTAHKYAVSLVVCYIIAIMGVIVLDHMMEGALISKFLAENNTRMIKVLIGITLTVISFIIGFLKHRWYTHSFVAAIVFSIGLFLIFPNYTLALAFLIGYVSHIIIDLPNYKGCSVLWPLNKEFCLKICKSDGIINWILFFVFTITTIMQIVFLSPYGDAAKQLIIEYLSK